EVFAEPEYPETHHQAREQPGTPSHRSSGPLDSEPDGVVHARREPQQRWKPPTRRQFVPRSRLNVRNKYDRVTDEKAGVEEMACEQEPYLAPCVTAQGPIPHPDDQEENEETTLGEQH